MPAEWSLQDAKNKFSEVVNAACAGSPQMVTNRGKKAVVVLAVDTYQQLLKQSRAEPVSFKDYLLAMPQSDEEFDLPDRSEQMMRKVDF